MNSLNYQIVENRCVMCGEIIPEGLQICPNCETHVAEFKDKDKNKFSIQSIVFPSFNSNPDGISADLFFKGCKLHCNGCHNKELQEFDSPNTSISDIISALETNKVKILTLMGGEPLDVDKVLLLELLDSLKGEFPALQLSLFTGHELKDVPIGLFSYLDYIKVGRYDNTKLNPHGSFLASSNQKFYKIVDNTHENYVKLRELGSNKHYVDEDFILYF